MDGRSPGGAVRRSGSDAHDDEAWRADLDAHAAFQVLAGTRWRARTRPRRSASATDETLLSAGPGIETEEFIGGIDVVSCADRQQAVEIAATHPIARYHAIEVRPFYSE